MFSFGNGFFRLKHPIKLDTYFDLEWVNELPERHIFDQDQLPSNPNSEQVYVYQQDDYREQAKYFKEEDSGEDSEEITSWYGSIKQEASYQFTKAVDASAEVKYSYRNDDYGKSGGEDTYTIEHNFSYRVMVMVKF